MTADPAIARYTLAFPAVCLALAAGELERLVGRPRLAALAFVTALAALGWTLALPGLTGEGPGLVALLGQPREAREAALLPMVHPERWAALRTALTPASTVATDDSFDLSYLLWRSDQANRVLRLPAGLAGEALLAWVDAQGIRLLICSADSPPGALALSRPDRFARQFPCGASDPACTVFAVRP